MIIAPIVFPIALLIVVIALSFKIVPEYQRLVVFFLGRFQIVKKPGLRLVVPGIQQMRRVEVSVSVGASVGVRLWLFPDTLDRFNTG